MAAAGRRRRRRRGGRTDEVAEDGGGVLRRLREARDDLLSSGFWAASAGAVRARLGGSAETPARCVCYGLGRFGGCPIAREQLAFLLLLLEELGVSSGAGSGAVSVPQPLAHSRRSSRRCRRAGAPCSTPCSRSRRRPCWRSWGCGCSRRTRLLPRILRRDYSYIAKVLKVTEEVALPSHPQYLDTFNDTSIHWFPLDKLQELSPEVWDFVEEPTYEDCDNLEIIRREDKAQGCSPIAAEP